MCFGAFLLSLAAFLAISTTVGADESNARFHHVLEIDALVRNVAESCALA